jgi:hypothetical protein
MKQFLITTMHLFVMALHSIIGQEVDQLKPTTKLSGFIKSDVFFDSRQTISAREGHFLLFPCIKKFDPDGHDINDKSSFNFLPIHSNLAVNSTGYKAIGAEIAGTLEGDFFGQSNGDVNMFRLRHAFIKFNWNTTELLIGQYWHPLFVTACYPGTISFNTGAPIQPFSRAPQIRVTQQIKHLKIYGALVSQRDNTSCGPEGNSSKYLRDSGMPEIQISAEFSARRTNELICGGGFGYKRLVPQITTSKNYKSTASVGGISSNLYSRFTSQHLTVKLELVYLENGSEFLSISGYAVRDSVIPQKGIVSYAPLRTLSCWGEIHSLGNDVQYGVFAGYTENLGTKDEVIGPFYLTSNAYIGRLYRISPRITYKSGNLSLSGEIEYTSALYGNPDSSGIMRETSEADNLRLLLSAVYKF